MALVLKSKFPRELDPVPKVLVTGATGFIGSVLVRRLAMELISSRVYSRASYQDCFNSVVRQEDWYKGSLFDEQEMLAAMASVDTVVHLAGIAHTHTARSGEYDAVNVEGTKCVYRACVGARVSRLIYVSSIRAETPTSSCYARSKWASEQYLRDEFKANSQVEITILRPANVYGVGMKGGLEDYIRLAIKPYMPPLPRVPTKFSLVSVDDLCAVIIKEISSKPQKGRIRRFTVSDERKYTPRDIEDIVWGSIGRARFFSSTPRCLFFLAAGLAELANFSGIRKNQIGLRLYRTLLGSQDASSGESFPRYDHASTVSLEDAMPKILASLA